MKEKIEIERDILRNKDILKNKEKDISRNKETDISRNKSNGEGQVEFIPLHLNIIQSTQFQNNRAFSYIPLLTAKSSNQNILTVNNSTNDLKDNKVPFKYEKLSTTNLLIFLEESFNNSVKSVLKKLDKIEKILLKRTDLFFSVLKYLENKQIRDDLFYWSPGYKVSNIFSFIVILIPNFPKIYKEYYVKNLICNRVFINVIHFLKERFPEEYETFTLINYDLNVFKDCISPNLWFEPTNELEYFEKTTSNSENILSVFGISKVIEISEDLEGYLAPLVSYFEFEIYGKVFLVNLLNFNGLINKNEKYKDWWILNGLTLEEWECL